MPSAFDGYGPRERVPTKVVCRDCKGSGEGPSGKCIYTGEFVDAPCPTCDGKGTVVVDL
jgi:DnaJ-class molecular chaperone